MLGTLRFFLSLCVVFAHLAALPAHFHTGVYAVFGFYVLSGFLVTGILNGAYRGRPGAFLANRALKIFPAYYLVAMLTIPVITLLPAGAYHPAWAATPSNHDVLANLLIFPLAWAKEADLRLIPPAWSVGVELVSYALIFLFVGRRWWLAAAMLAASSGYHAHAIMTGMPWGVRYFPIAAAALPFSIGAAIFFSKSLIARGRGWLIGIGGTTWIANLGGMDTSTAAGLTITFGPGFYINLFSLATLIAGLATLPRLAFDDYLGDLSYPLFLLHWLVGFLTTLLFGLAPHGAIAFAVSLPVALAAAVALNQLLQATIDPLQIKIRRRRETSLTRQFPHLPQPAPTLQPRDRIAP